MALLTSAAGGVTGVGTPVLLRAMLDEPGAEPTRQPSVLYGLGAGAVGLGAELARALGLYRLGPAARDFVRTHAGAAFVGGVLSAFFPKTSSGTVEFTVPASVDAAAEDVEQQTSEFRFSRGG